AGQIGSALETAHRASIFHRDLKPANVMVTASGAKLLDFGLAKIDADVDVTRTIEGTVLGTVAYMSPEQAEGKPADARSDIFSFDAVFYEMLAGRRPFSGNSAAATLGAIVHKEPDPLNAPPGLQAIVLKCLSKSAEGRFQS